MEALEREMDEALSTPPLRRTRIDNSSLVINGELKSFESTASFSNILRTEGQAYFDRTRYISFLESRNKPILFFRPRRFVKSLTISMLEHFHSFRYAHEHESFYQVCNHVLGYPNMPTYFSLITIGSRCSKRYFRRKGETWTVLHIMPRLFLHRPR